MKFEERNKFTQCLQRKGKVTVGKKFMHRKGDRNSPGGVRNWTKGI